MTDEIKEEATALIEPKTETPVKEVEKKVVKRRGPAKKAAEMEEKTEEVLKSIRDKVFANKGIRDGVSSRRQF
jgi:hypothetical protein